MRIKSWSRLSELKAGLGELLASLRTTRKLILASPEDLEAQFKDDPQYTEAESFKEEIELKDGVDYEWVWEHAKDTFDRSESTYKELDDKANDIIKYLGGGTGLFTLAVLANIRHENACVILAAIPTFLLALISVTVALRARQPNPATRPPDIRSAFKFAEHYEKSGKARAYFLGQWHLTCKGLDLANS